MKATTKNRALANDIERRTGTLVTPADAATLRRAELTLHRWAEEECNGTIQREGEHGDGAPYRYTTGGKAYRVPDRERGALARIAETCSHLGLYWYHQTDPRGCALYVSREPITDRDYYHGIACCSAQD